MAGRRAHRFKAFPPLSCRWGEHRHRRVVGINLVRGEHMLLHGVDQGSEQLTRRADPSGQRGAI